MPLSEEQVASLICHWQRVLNILHWRVDYKITDVGRIANSLMEIRPTRVRHHARIFIKTKCLQLNETDFEKLIVHELVHLIYDPLAEEHSLQIDYDSNEERKVEHKDRFTRQLEKAVEHTAQMLSTLLTEHDLKMDSDVATYVFDPTNLRILYCCPGVAQYLQYPSVFSIMGKSMAIVDPTISFEAVQAKFTLLTHGRGTLEFNSKHVNSKDELVAVHVTATLGPNTTDERPQIMEQIRLVQEHKA